MAPAIVKIITGMGHARVAQAETAPGPLPVGMAADQMPLSVQLVGLSFPGGCLSIRRLAYAAPSIRLLWLLVNAATPGMAAGYTN